MSSRSQRFAILRTARRICFAAIVVALCAHSSAILAQNAARPGFARTYPANPGLRPITHPAIPTDQLAAVARMNPQKSAVLQPIQWKLPEGVKVSVAQDGAFVPAEEDNLFGLQVGTVYRFKIEGLPSYPNQALYPTLELIDRIRPPQGKEWEFPIEIEASANDLAVALRGALVTRVVFLENPENALAVDASESNENLTFDIPNSLDPVLAAKTHGRALAILRIGARAPQGEPNANDPFFFGLPKVVFKPKVVESTENSVPNAGTTPAPQTVAEQNAEE